MEYKSNTVPDIRDTALDYYELRIRYTDPSGWTPAENLLSKLTHVLTAILSYNVLFQVQHMTCECNERNYRLNTFKCSIRMSGGLPMTGAAFYLSKMTESVFGFIKYNGDGYVKLYCGATGMETYLCADHRTKMSDAASPDVAAVKWSAINDNYSGLPPSKKNSEYVEHGGQSCYVLPAAQNRELQHYVTVAV